MKKTSYELDIFTPCFCGGADPQQKAEIRAPSIRGQLRWWFRVLGGFKSLSPIPLADQEARVFGSAAGDEGTASKLLVRVSNLQSAQVKDADEMGAPMLSPKGYLLFPLRSNTKRNEYKGRAVLENGTFTLSLIWRGDANLWPDILALVAVFGHLGSLGFRSRRGFGSMAFAGDNIPGLTEALIRFPLYPEAVKIRVLASARDTDDALNRLGAWLKNWRAHGRSQDHVKSQTGSGLPPHNIGFHFAKEDHDAGYGLNRNGPTYRAALGLPIIQRCQNGTHNWELGTGRDKGRFASPVILRPYRTQNNQIKCLVLFIDSLAWATGGKVYLDGVPRLVSRDLYDAMKNDSSLSSFDAV